MTQYKKEFYLAGNRGNNAFLFEDNVERKLYIPKLKKISSFDKIELLDSGGDKITFEDVDEHGEKKSCYGLKYLYEYNFHLFPLPLQGRGTTKAKIFIVDNHNHALYFWYQAYVKGLLTKESTLYHIDEHADTRDPGIFLSDDEGADMQRVWDFVNLELNVGNYIIPALKAGLVGELLQLRSESALQELGEGRENSILNIDLDFFQPELDYIPFDLKKETIHRLAAKASIITIATSPYFIDQELALKRLGQIFDI